MSSYYDKLNVIDKNSGLRDDVKKEIQILVENGCLLSTITKELFYIFNEWYDSSEVVTYANAYSDFIFQEG